MATRRITSGLLARNLTKCLPRPSPTAHSSAPQWAWTRAFSQSHPRKADDEPPHQPIPGPDPRSQSQGQTNPASSPTTGAPTAKPGSTMEILSSLLGASAAVKPSEPVQPSGPVQPIQPVQPIDPVQPVDPARHGVSGQLSLPKSLGIQPRESAGSMSSSGSTRPHSENMDVLSKLISQVTNEEPMPEHVEEKILEGEELAISVEPWHFHVYSHRHNTHITVTKPDRGAVISMSTGQLGFRKAQRKSYDAAYQLGAFVLKKLYHSEHAMRIKKLEVVLRGFGQGREAVTKLLLGMEGRWLRQTITRVSDSTRLKFGGTRSKKPRRLG